MRSDVCGVRARLVASPQGYGLGLGLGLGVGVGVGVGYD